MMHGEVTLKHDNLIQRAKVKGRTLSPDGRIIGTFDENPLLNALACDFEFEDRDVREFMANAISENMLSITDADGHVTMELQVIINHRKDETA